MADSHIRKRKKDQKGQKEKEKATQPTREGDSPGNDLDFVDSASLLQYTKILWIPLLLAFGVFVYLNPSTVNEIISFWIEQEDLQATSGSRAEDFVGFTADVPKRDAVVEAFKHAWRAYERDAMGADEYHPMSHKGTNLTEAGGIGYTVIDSIDTMLMMGLKDDYGRARTWVENKLSFERDANFNTFETTIRVLGGLLSAYHLSDGDRLFLEKAIDLADRITPAFDTPSGLPLPMVNLAKRRGVPDPELPALVSTAEAATLQLEFRYLSHLTENEEYWDKAENVMRIIKAARMPHGLASIYMHAESGKFVPSAIRLGSRGDSYYEYLLKQYLQTNQTETVYRDMYDDAMDAIHEHLIKKSPYARLTYTAELIPERRPDGQLSWQLTPKQDHLVCFLGGSLMLGATTSGAAIQPVSVPPLQREFTSNGQRDWDSGVALVKTCMDTHDTATGLSPEIAYFRMPGDGMEEQALTGSGEAPSDWYIKGAKPGEFPPYDARYILRPETVESLFLAFRLTGDARYRNWGWNIFQAIEKHCRVPTGGYASIINVDEVPSRMEDKMETFMMSETLKYLYLLFEDAEALPLDKFVLNTEAHPFPIFNPTIRTGFT
ncbi:glycoside hydrolase family 47 protein [Moniliophthora roreri MCA 2997]|uniref:alpha-1,2-Mannosidase n=1 Tax=Moniliophthora roreri (strain MCA 2997) TaxID=1381753 RepID=V2YNU7_MONRO|nr:glycoside hydrolase family 47 protein [Moniliophthora roreri MCA 2997]